jgi:hypothetical protein
MSFGALVQVAAESIGENVMLLGPLLGNQGFKRFAKENMFTFRSRPHQIQ